MASALNNLVVREHPETLTGACGDAIMFYGKKMCKATAQGPQTTLLIVRLPLCSVLRVHKSTKTELKKPVLTTWKLLRQPTSCSMHSNVFPNTSVQKNSLKISQWAVFFAVFTNEVQMTYAMQLRSDFQFTGLVLSPNKMFFCHVFLRIGFFWEF